MGVASTESVLYGFSSNPALQVDTVDRTKGWLCFDRVYFDPGKATLTPESMRQLKNIALLLQSYPTPASRLGATPTAPAPTR